MPKPKPKPIAQSNTETELAGLLATRTNSQTHQSALATEVSCVDVLLPFGATEDGGVRDPGTSNRIRVVGAPDVPSARVRN